MSWFNSKKTPAPAPVAAPKKKAAPKSQQAKNQAAKQKIRKEVAAKFAADGVRLDEVVLKSNGDIVIDRRATQPRATPMVVGKWS